MKQGLAFALGIFVGNWLAVPLLFGKPTHGDGFFTGLIAAIFVLCITALIIHLRNCAVCNREGGETIGKNKHDPYDSPPPDLLEDDDCCSCPCSPCRTNPPRQDGIAESQCCSCHDLGEFDEGGSG